MRATTNNYKLQPASQTRLLQGEQRVPFPRLLPRLISLIPSIDIIHLDPLHQLLPILQTTDIDRHQVLPIDLHRNISTTRSCVHKVVNINSLSTYGFIVCDVCGHTTFRAEMMVEKCTFVYPVHILVLLLQLELLQTHVSLYNTCNIMSLPYSY